jgi:hypothetical protein
MDTPAGWERLGNAASVPERWPAPARIGRICSPRKRRWPLACGHFGKEGGAEEKGGTEGGTAWARGVIGCGHYVPVGFC